MLREYLERRLVEIQRDGTQLRSQAVVKQARTGAIALEHGRRLEDTTKLVSRQWVDFVVELAHRLEGDRTEIGLKLFGGRDIGRADVIEAGLGDPHDDGRCVSAVTFECGLRVAYKPRPVALLRAWGDLVGEVGLLAGDDAIVTADVIDQGTYGWVRWISPVPCANDGEVQRLARRSGLMLAVADVLGATDLHRENLIGHGDCPVLIDAETLLRIAWVRPPSVDSVRRAAFDALIADGVVRTGLVPRWQWVDARTVDHSPLGQWIPDSHVDTMIEGLRVGYEALQSEHGKSAVDRFLATVDGLPVRAVVRPTCWYRKAMDALPCVDALRSRNPGRADSTRRLAEDAAVPIGGMAPLAPVEVESLLRRDIPRIEIRAEQQVPGLPRIDHTLSFAAYVRKRRAQLDPTEHARQEALLRACVALREATDHSGAAGGISESATAPADLLSTAEGIGKTVLDGAIRCARGLLWITNRPVGSRYAWHLAPADFGFYDGNAGIASFLAALWKCTGAPLWRETMIDAVRPLVEAVTYAGAGPSFGHRFGIGGAEGMGGALFGLALTERISAESIPWDEILTAARGVARLEAPHELLYGKSGFILGALAAWQVSRLEGFRYLATGAAHCLIDALQATDTTDGPGTPRRPVPDGIAHGISGVLLAIAAVASEGDATCRTALDALIEAYLSLDVGAFDVSRTASVSADKALSWCSGAAGELIILDACDGMVSAHLQRRVEQKRAESALVLARSRSFERVDLCCGLSARIDAMISMLSARERARVLAPPGAPVQDRHRIELVTDLQSQLSLLVGAFESGR
ncbi:MAG TPA: DUF4135 domain-containing protein, partial [Rhodothermales bacterium]